MDSKTTQKELLALNARQAKRRDQEGETEEMTLRQIEKLKDAVLESKTRLSDSLNFLIETLTE